MPDRDTRHYSRRRNLGTHRPFSRPAKSNPSRSAKSHSSQIDSAARPSSYKKGGVVKKTGLAKLHKGEWVLTKKKSQALKIKLRKRKKLTKAKVSKKK